MRSVSRRKRVTLLLASVVVLGAALIARAVGEPPVPWVREGDRSAAAFADGTVLDQVQQIASTASDPVPAVAAFFAAPEADLGILDPFALTLVARHGDTFVADASRHVEDTSLLLGTGDSWGHACREYTVDGDRRVTAMPVACSADAPAVPAGDNSPGA